MVIIVKDPIKLDWGRHVMGSSKNSHYYFTVHPHTNLGNKPIHISEIDQFSIWSIQCIIVILSNEKLVNHTSVQCADLVHCVSESEIGFWKAKSPCANGERGTLGVTRLVGQGRAGRHQAGRGRKAARWPARRARVSFVYMRIYSLVGFSSTSQRLPLPPFVILLVNTLFCHFSRGCS